MIEAKFTTQSTIDSTVDQKPIPKRPQNANIENKTILSQVATGFAFTGLLLPGLALFGLILGLLDWLCMENKCGKKTAKFSLICFVIGTLINLFLLASMR